MAIEVKHRNCTVHCHGDRWWFDRYDRYGNRVGGGSLTDARGRSPSMQLNEPADQLERFLAAWRALVVIRRVVIFTHPRARAGSLIETTVEIATDPARLLDLIDGSPQPLTPRRRAAIESLILAAHARRRPQPRPPHGRG